MVSRDGPAGRRLVLPGLSPEGPAVAGAADAGLGNTVLASLATSGDGAGSGFAESGGGPSDGAFEPPAVATGFIAVVSGGAEGTGTATDAVAFA